MVYGTEPPSFFSTFSSSCSPPSQPWVYLFPAIELLFMITNTTAWAHNILLTITALSFVSISTVISNFTCKITTGHLSQTMVLALGVFIGVVIICASTHGFRMWSLFLPGGTSPVIYFNLFMSRCATLWRCARGRFPLGVSVFRKSFQRFFPWKRGFRCSKRPLSEWPGL